MIRRLRCRISGHFPDFVKPYRANVGIDFATCLHCRTPILKRPDKPWQRPERGMAIVWRAAARPAEPPLESIMPPEVAAMALAVGDGADEARPGPLSP